MLKMLGATIPNLVMQDLCTLVCVLKKRLVYFCWMIFLNKHAEKNFLLFMAISEVILFKLVDIKFLCNGGLQNYFCVHI